MRSSEGPTKEGRLEEHLGTSEKGENGEAVRGLLRRREDIKGTVRGLLRRKYQRSSEGPYEEGKLEGPTED